MSRFILVYSDSNQSEQRFDLELNRSYRLGTKPDNDIVLEHEDVSRHHAIIRVQDGAFHITDLNSKNGTFVNGTPVADASFRCGDLLGLSSARLVLVEMDSSAETVPPGGRVGESETEPEQSEETHEFRSTASLEEMVSLLEATAVAARDGAYAEPLAWAIRNLGFKAVLVLYRDPDGGVAMVSSAGDLGALVGGTDTLARLVQEQAAAESRSTRVRQVSEMGEDLIVATLRDDHYLMVRYSGPPPVVDDIRALIASIQTVLYACRPK